MSIGSILISLEEENQMPDSADYFVQATGLEESEITDDDINYHLDTLEEIADEPSNFLALEEEIELLQMEGEDIDGDLLKEIDPERDMTLEDSQERGERWFRNFIDNFLTSYTRLFHAIGNFLTGVESTVHRHYGVVSGNRNKVEIAASKAKKSGKDIVVSMAMIQKFFTTAASKRSSISSGKGILDQLKADVRDMEAFSNGMSGSFDSAVSRLHAIVMSFKSDGDFYKDVYSKVEKLPDIEDICKPIQFGNKNRYLARTYFGFAQTPKVSKSGKLAKRLIERKKPFILSTFSNEGKWMIAASLLGLSFPIVTIRTALANSLRMSPDEVLDFMDHADKLGKSTIKLIGDTRKTLDKNKDRLSEIRAKLESVKRGENKIYAMAVITYLDNIIDAPGKVSGHVARRNGYLLQGIRHITNRMIAFGAIRG